MPISPYPSFDRRDRIFTARDRLLSSPQELQTQQALAPLAALPNTAAPAMRGSSLIGTGYGGDRLDGSQNLARPELSPLAASAVSPTLSQMNRDAIGREGSVAALSPTTSSALYEAQKAAIGRGESYRKGGPVKGPGTSTSDSIDARLSNNEYVLTPAMVEALGGEKALEDLRARTMKPGFAQGGPVDDERRRNKAALAAPQGAYDPVSGARLDYADTGSENLQRTGGKGASEMLAEIGRAYQNAFIPTPSLAPAAQTNQPLPTPMYGNYNRSADNPTGPLPQTASPLAAAAVMAPPKPVNYALSAANGGAGNGFMLRDAIKTGTTPGTQMQSDYGYGDTITATADKNGKLNSFSGIGGSGNQAVKPGLADYAAGKVRAANDKETLAAIERNRYAPLDPLTQQALAVGDARLNQSAQQSALAQALLPQQVASQQASLAHTTAQTSLLGAQAKGAEQSVAQQQKVSVLGDQLATETDPAKIAQIHSRLLALLGKDKPEEYQVIHAAGGIDPTDPMGQRKLGDNVIVANKRTGKYEVVPIGASKPQTVVTKSDYAAMVKQVGSEDAVRKMLLDKGLTVEK